MYHIDGSPEIRRSRPCSAPAARSPSVSVRPSASIRAAPSSSRSLRTVAIPAAKGTELSQYDPVYITEPAAAFSDSVPTNAETFHPLARALQ